MVNITPFQYLLVDNESLAVYKNGEFVDLKSIRRRMLLKSREFNRAIPDHHYRLLVDNAFDQINNVSDIFTIAIPKIADHYLYDVNYRIYVQSELQNSWQELLTFIPPLFLQCSYLAYSNPEKISSSNLEHYCSSYILPNTQFTCIPSANIAQLDYHLDKEKGLSDLHMHLNGSLETDQVWQDFLHHPEEIRNDLKRALRDEKVAEQFEQESLLLRHDEFYKLLKIAQNLREFFYQYLHTPTVILNKYRKDTLLQELLHGNKFTGNFEHPFKRLVSSDPAYRHLMTVEGIMYMQILQEIHENPNSVLPNFLHFYLLILGLSNRLLVQQTHQNGFEQFQKHTLNNLRETSEKEFRRRYYQLHGNDMRVIKFLEGRFSPKAKESETKLLIDNIYKGWNAMTNELNQLKPHKKKPYYIPELKLIAHFIKASEKTQDNAIRHKDLRKSVWEKANSLASLLNNHADYKEKVVAVDAAASEFDAPPEVFAPAFRLMRQKGMQHFTYHAGEDFYHIISGLRAIYEAIIFCDLKNGDRIGHATATGLSVHQWHNVVGEQILIQQGEYLDNLVFAYAFIVEKRIHRLYKQLPFILNTVLNTSYDIYKGHYAIDVLVAAWKLRQCCPFHIFETKYSDVTIIPASNLEWTLPVKKSLLDKQDRMGSSALEIFRLYHSSSTRNRYKKIITINPFEIFSPSEIEELQLEMLSEMNRREIVVETLPTSNVRIGFHQNFSSYHLWNWLKWKKEGKSIPPIVVGSDDAGIFATNIYNEYANIFCMLLNTHQLSHSEIASIIKQLIEDSNIYRFK